MDAVGLSNDSYKLSASAKLFVLEHVRLTKETGRKLAISAHAPYYINLNAATPEKIQESSNRILKAAERSYEVGATSVVFHPGFYLKESSDVVTKIIGESIAKIMQQYPKDYPTLRPETTGKINQFGSIEELALICREQKSINICIDFAHLHARSQGKLNTYESFCQVFQSIENLMGKSYLQSMHIHYSGILYGLKGELKHLPLNESDSNWMELMKALKDFQIKGVIICESPEQEKDALMMQQYYQAL